MPFRGRPNAIAILRYGEIQDNACNSNRLQREENKSTKKKKTFPRLRKITHSVFHSGFGFCVSLNRNEIRIVFLELS